MRTLPRLTLILFAVVLLCAPAAASASLYCVNATQTSCPGGTDEGNDLQKALSDAAANVPTANTINVGPGTFTPQGAATEFVYTSPTKVLTLTGTGATGTTLSGGSGANVLTLSAPAGSTISGLTVKAAGAGQNGVILHNTAATDLTLTLPGSSSGTALTLDSSSLTNGSVTAANPLTTSVGVVANNGATSLAKVTMTVQKGIDVTGGTFNATNLRLTTTGFGIVAENPGTTATVNVGLLTMPNNASAANRALLAQLGGALNVRSLTMIGAKQSTVGVGVNATGANTSSATVTDSIFFNFFHDLDRSADPTGFANLTLDHDIATTSTDPGAAVPGATSFTSDVAGDPRFVNANQSDFRPLYNSPAIDSGTSCTGLCPTLPDMAGLTRPINGVLDRGAFEYARRPPSVNAVASETQRFIGGVSSFTAQGTDPDNDPLTYAWVFDDGATATGAMVNHQFATLGFHNATVTATDPTGQTASATATTQIITPVPAPGPGGFPPGGGGGTPSSTPLTLTGLKLSNAKFAVSTSKTATSAKAKTPKGTTIRFTLSKPATVKFAFEQELKGVKAGGKCVKKSKRHSHGTSCKLLELKGTIIRRNLAAGLRSVAFSGRIGSKPLHRGSFRLTATATDSAGAHVAKHAEFKIA